MTKHVNTWKNKFNRKFGFDKDKSHSLAEIARLTGYSKRGLRIIYSKGLGAYRTNPSSVRPVVRRSGGAVRWAYARVYSSVMGGKAAKIDKAHLNKTKPASRKRKRT